MPLHPALKEERPLCRRKPLGRTERSREPMHGEYEMPWPGILKDFEPLVDS